jgi:hypothetical protein
MDWIRQHPRALVIGIGVVFAAVGPFWVGDGSGVGGIVFFLGLEAIPFLALAAVSTDMPWWLGVSAATVFGALTDSGIRSIENSTSSTAVIEIPFIPLVLLVAVPLLLAACDVVVLGRHRVHGGAIERPTRGEVALALVLAAFGFLAFFVFGLAAGLATAFAVWAHRVRPEQPA